ncbi:DUF4180 domain-containing protein [Kineothrix sp. MB12-C1]|uniref:DUF4180 domain-containing protein n=1 Tax=Kineothrix sp. MB12-C1 TaxID=3070215 RepID=UPI0027D2053F|nr:DUF4180 domain-containing protein [Kineothrix sp. MB12-C1]WMC91470.1 DUF4180 domain-containing protein [Kineothrix sp. MB12-C1]
MKTEIISLGEIQIEKIEMDGNTIAYIRSDSPILTDVQSALDLIATVDYQTGCSNLILDKESIVEEFFDLKTRLAGEIIQKYVNYRVRLAIVGDFSGYTSKALRDFIYECNHGKDLFFVSDKEEALKRLL